MRSSHELDLYAASTISKFNHFEQADAGFVGSLQKYMYTDDQQTCSALASNAVTLFCSDRHYLRAFAHVLIVAIWRSARQITTQLT